MITASQLNRVAACPASETLPPLDVSSEWAARGTALHKYLQHLDELGSTGALALIAPEYQKECASLDVDIPPGALMEVAFAYDMATGKARQLVGCTNREYCNYEPTKTEVCGTVDMVFVTDDAVYVDDWKSGGKKYPQPHTSPTMMLYALCASQVFSRDVVHLSYRNLDTGQRPRSTIDSFDLAKFATQLNGIFAQVEKARRTKDADQYFNEGEHCRYCPGQDECPPRLALQRRITSGDMDREVEIMWAGGINRNPQTLKQCYAQLKAVKRLTKRMSDILHAIAKEEAFEAEDGIMFGEMHKRGNEKFDGSVTWQVVSELHGAEVADQACKKTVSKKDLKAAIKAAVPHGAAASSTKKVEDLVRERGGASRKPSVKIGEYVKQLTDN